MYEDHNCMGLSAPHRKGIAIILGYLLDVKFNGQEKYPA